MEAKEQLTRECLKLLAKYRIRTNVTTRSPLIMRDLDILAMGLFSLPIVDRQLRAIAQLQLIQYNRQHIAYRSIA